MGLTVVSCTEDVWTKVLANVTAGWVYLQGEPQDPDVAYFTYVATGGSAPSVNPGASGSTAILMRSQDLPINSASAIDVYIFPPRASITVAVDAS